MDWDCLHFVYVIYKPELSLIELTAYNPGFSCAWLFLQYLHICTVRTEFSCAYKFYMHKYPETAELSLAELYFAT
jgi:hypothetical protein